jgi:2'-5' RNA ligase
MTKCIIKSESKKLSGASVNYSIGLYFDETTEKKIRSLWQEIAERGISDYLALSDNRPHFTLAIFTNLDAPAAGEKLADIAAKNKSMQVQFSYIGCFLNPEPDLFLGPVATPDLLEFHQYMNRQFSELGTYPDFNYYQPGYWVPHCAIAMGVDFQNIQAVMHIARDHLVVPMAAQIIEIGLIEFRPVKQLFTFGLGK